MFNAKTIILAKALRPDLNFASPGAEELIWLKIASRYASGNPVHNATISNGIAYFDGVTVSQPLVSLKLNIPVTQTGSGTPSPDNIRNFIGFSGVNISRTGKNLLDVSNTEIVRLNMWFYGNSSTYKFWKAGTYMCSAIFSSAGISINYTLQGNSMSSNIMTAAKSGLRALSFTLPQDGYYRIFAQKPGGISADDVINPMIASSDDLTYEPYTGNTYQITFGQTVYSANLDVLTGKLSITHKIVDMGDLEWKTALAATRFVTEDITDISLEADFTNMFCSCYDVISSSTSFANMPDKSIKRGQSNTTISVRDLDYTDASLFTTSVTGMKLVYELATPIEIQLTPTQIITTLIGENVIFADVADVTECKYTRK
jgi:hypothetical protein